MKYITSNEFKTRLKSQSLESGIGVRKDISEPFEDVGNRQIKFTISTENPDRDGDVVMQAGVDLAAYRKNPVVLWGHKADEPPIGKCVEIGIEDGKLKATVEFLPADNPWNGAQAEGVYQGILFGSISAISIGFMPTEFEPSDDESRSRGYDKGMNWIRSNLLEFSVVSCPANPEALIEPGQRSSEPEITKTGDREPTTDATVSDNSRARRRRITTLLSHY